jgi:hypothetical protein
LLPEQLRALAYAKKRGSDAPLASIRSRVAATYAEFETLVDALPAATAREHRSTSAWSIQEVVDHLVESERPAVRQLSRLLAGQSVAEPIPASLQSRRPLAHDWATLRSQFRTVHEDILAVLAQASDAIPFSATAAVQMVVKCADPDGVMRPVSWVEHLDWKAYAILLHAHNREHMAQVQRILDAPGAS